MQLSLAGRTLDNFLLAERLFLAPFANHGHDNTHTRHAGLDLVVLFLALLSGAAQPLRTTSELFGLGPLAFACAAQGNEDAVIFRLSLVWVRELLVVIHSGFAVTVRLLSADHRYAGRVIVLAIPHRPSNRIFARSHHHSPFTTQGSTSSATMASARPRRMSVMPLPTLISTATAPSPRAGEKGTTMN